MSNRDSAGEKVGSIICGGISNGCMIDPLFNGFFVGACRVGFAAGVRRVGFPERFELVRIPRPFLLQGGAPLFLNQWRVLWRVSVQLVHPMKETVAPLSRLMGCNHFTPSGLFRHGVQYVHPFIMGCN